MSNDADALVERLRAVGDGLADALRDARRRHPCDCADGYDGRTGAAAIAEWDQARESGTGAIDAANLIDPADAVRYLAPPHSPNQA